MKGQRGLRHIELVHSAEGLGARLVCGPGLAENR